MSNVCCAPETTNKFVSQDGVELLRQAQNGNVIAEEELIVLIRDKFMNKRISKYLSRNRQVENEDLKQEFLIGVALNINRARIDIGDPIEYIISQGVYRVRTYLRKFIIKGTVQVCQSCGNVSRLNQIDSQYICKKCGSSNNVTQELSDHDEIALDNAVDDTLSIEDEVCSIMMLESFEKTLSPNTNVTNVYHIMKEGLRDKPEVKNYIKEIARVWGCSENNVVQTIDKLRNRLLRFARENNCEIKNGMFIII